MGAEISQRRKYINRAVARIRTSLENQYFGTAHCRFSGIDHAIPKKAEGLNIKIHSLIIRAIESVGSFLNAAGINKYISNYIANGSLKRKDMLYTEI